MSAPRSLLLVHPATLRGENRGVYVQHVSSLQWLLDGDGWSVTALDPVHPAFPELALTSDVVVVHMLPHREIETMIRIRRERGLPTIFELSDNFLALGDWLPRAHPLRSPLVRQRLLYHATLCDALQLYAAGLRELFARVNPRIVLFDPYVPIGERIPEKPEGFVFGWGGTTSHEHDLQRIAPAAIELCARHPDAVFAYMGDLDMFERYFAAIPREQTRVAPFGPFPQYLDFVRGLHAGIAPADDSAFNAGRSDTKFVTYAAAGAVPLLSDVAPYRVHAGQALLFGTAAELLTLLEALYADPARRTELAERAFAWVREHRGAAALRGQRDRFYRSLLRNEPAGATSVPLPDAPASAATLNELGQLAPEAALPVARELAAVHPDWTQARWALASLLGRLRRKDEMLDALSGYAWPLLYGDGVEELRALAATTPEEAESHIARIRSPFTRLRLRTRDRGRGDAFFRAILREQPYDYFALSAVIHTLERDDPHSAELQPLYERACLVAPESVPRARRPADLEMLLPT